MKGEQNRHVDHLSSCERNLYDYKQAAEGSQLGISAFLRRFQLLQERTSIQAYLVSKWSTT